MRSQLSDTLVSIYDASLHPDSWDYCLDHCAEYIGAKSSTIQSIDASGSTYAYNITRSSSFIREIDASVIQHYAQVLMQYENVAWQFLSSHPKHTLVVDNEIWRDGDEKLSVREDYAYLLKHLGTLRRLAIKLHDNAQWIDAVAFQFDSSRSEIPKDCKKQLFDLLPHLSKSTEIGHYFHELRSRYNAVLTALDHVCVGLIVMDDSCNLIVHNKEADRIFRMQDGISLTSARRIQCASPEHTAIIYESVRNCILAAKGTGGSEESVLTLLKRSSNERYIVEVSPLSDSADELGQKLRGALITIIDVENIKSINIEKLSLSYQLTKAESSVCELMIDGLSNVEISETRGVSPETIKSQVNSIYRKTNSNKRSQLIRLALQVSPPIDAIQGV